jgi:hypothetical protein
MSATATDSTSTTDLPFENSFITVTVKLMNGDLLQIEYDSILSIAGLKDRIQQSNQEFLPTLQTLIRLSDEEVNPTDISDGDSFVLLIQPEEIRIRFYDESLCDSFSIQPQQGDANYHHSFELHSLYHINTTSEYYFLYDVDSNQYAIANTCVIRERPRGTTYYFTDDTIWYSSLYQSLQSFYGDLFPEEHPLIDQLEVRFKKHRVDIEFKL